MDFVSKWLPNSYFALKSYTFKTFLSDLPAGITVGLVALPLAMAFAIASGVPPQAGIYCAVVTGFIISVLGGSNVQIGGPTGAFVVVVSGIIAKHGLDGLFLCTMMAGVMLVIMGATGLGRAVRYIPRPVVLGFTNGIAVLIASTQIRDFFGLKILSVPGEFLPRMKELARHFSTLSLEATLLAAVSLVVILLTPKLLKRVPGYIVALVFGTAAVMLFKLPVETIGSRFGGIPTGLPKVDIPDFRPELMLPLMSSAMTVAMLGAIESLMSAVVADRMTGSKHNPNTELIGQGVANIVSPMFGGLPATGAIARTATNVRSGAKTPVSGMIHAATLLVVLLVAAPLAKFVPMPVLAAILLVVSYNMGEWAETAKLLRLSKSSVAVWLVTFTLTVVADLTHAVEFGMILAALTFIQKVSETTTVSAVTESYLADGQAHILQDKHIPPYVRIFRIHGPFMFGTTEKLSVVSEQLATLPPIVILRLRNMTALDSTGMKELEDLADKLHSTNRTLILCGAREQPSKMLHQAEFEEHVGRENICPNVKMALARSEAVMFGANGGTMSAAGPA